MIETDDYGEQVSSGKGFAGSQTMLSVKIKKHFSNFVCCPHYQQSPSASDACRKHKQPTLTSQELLLSLRGISVAPSVFEEVHVSCGVATVVTCLGSEAT